jgi:transketolase
MKGVIEWSDLTRYGSHCDYRASGVPFTTGSLGCGLGLASGVALAKKLTGESGRVYVLVGDGELYEGSIWEGIRFAGEKELGNLTMIVDNNGKSSLSQTFFLGQEFWAHFNWLYDYCRADHYGFTLSEGLEFASRDSLVPRILEVQTVKGKGLPTLEKDPLCHVRKVIDGRVV